MKNTKLDVLLSGPITINKNQPVWIFKTRIKVHKVKTKFIFKITNKIYKLNLQTIIMKQKLKTIDL